MKNKITNLKSIFAAALLFAAASTNAQTWNTTGNTGTNPATDFVGTTDANALKIRTNNQLRVIINSTGNVGIGTKSPSQKLDVNGGIKASGIVYAPGFQLDSGGNSFQWNTAYGWGNHATAGYLTSETDPVYSAAPAAGITGTNITNWNTAFGWGDHSLAGYLTYENDPKVSSSTIGKVPVWNGGSLSDGIITQYNFNIGIGTTTPTAKLEVYEADAKINGLTIGIGGVGLGSTTNTAIGNQALNLNTSTGWSNTAIGYQSMYNNLTADYNTATGYKSLYANTAGPYNTAIGYYALSSNTTGGYNTAISYALPAHIVGNNNTAMGYSALNDDTSGVANTAMGSSALSQNTNGNHNTGMGTSSLITNKTGNYNTGLGYYADVSAGNLNNATALGYNAKVTVSNKVRLGNASVTVIEGQVAYTFPSDGRFKKNVNEDVPGLVFINKLRPVTYTFETKKFDEFLHQNDKDFATLSSQTDYAPSEKVVQTGFIAQEVEKTMHETGYNFNGVHAPESEIDNYGVSYELFVMPLVKAVQELDAKNNLLADENAQLKKDIAEIKSALNIKSTESKIADAQTSNSKITVSPNPFNESTVVSFKLPKEVSSASIKILSVDGRELKSIVVNDRGNVTVNISANELSSGNYLIQIITDGKIMDSKKVSCIK